ncbi:MULTISPECIES: allophanate hydrolase [Acinetobacter]|uniref:Allophanate hydrolase n=1 Tax=Acinetobacter chengduensis TaxID=2420890 RepID=A0ABX9U1I5_9GAMM|nr:MULTISPECIES: allophanate hydrolase [Acinetobacter]RKG42999.1 allophanate hydrolase [Acinetobacter sp. WCHAc060007]RLL24708.1 allophanate hydrolase [Acinetobacter chengduensis]
MNPIKTLGWTLAEWKAGYADNTIQLEDLYALVEQFDRADPAWISIASKEQLTAQIDALKKIENATTLALFGVPIAVKDNIDVAGFASTAAFKLFTYLKTQDAYVVQRLKQAGAIIVGKTNLDQFATGLVGTRSPFGAVQNTFNPDYVSGGSSSGSGSVVARGLVPIALGTDTAGSGRIPAAFNNIVGLKPTKGRFSNTGLLPACKSIDCISIFALTVADANDVALLMEGFDVQDSYSRVNPATAPAKLSEKLKLAIPKQLEFFGDTQSADAFQQALLQLKNLGAEITEIDFSAFNQLASQLYQGSWVAERTAAVADLLETSAQDFDPTVLEIIQKGKQYSAVDTYRAEYLKQDLARNIQQTLAQFDALVVPSSPTIHTLAEMAEAPIENNSHFGTYTNFTNLADLSAIAVPAGFRADGLPFGITLIAPAWHDAALADFAQTWQQHLQLPLGAINKKWPESSRAISAPSAQHFRVAVVGAHLSGMPLNFQLTTRQAVHVETTTTSADYALFALPGTVPPKPGLARQDEGQKIIVELWDIPKARFGEFVAEIPTPLGMGNVELADGRWVKGFICEPYGLNGAKNISEFGGWRAYIQSLQQTTAKSN